MNCRKRKEYKEVSHEYQKLFKEISDKLPEEKDLLNDYEKIELAMYNYQVLEAYKTGYIDSIYMLLGNIEK